MGKVRKIAGTLDDATLPKTPVTIDGKEYNLCCDMGVLATAETRINRELALAGSQERVNLLYAMVEENLTNMRVLFAASLRTFQPELSYREALALVRFDTAAEVLLALRAAYRAAMPEKKDNPPTAQASK